MDFREYDHKKYEGRAVLEWLVLGECPIGDYVEGYDSSGFTPCGKWRWCDRPHGYTCWFIPGGEGWDYGARCSPLWIKRYKIPKLKKKGEDAHGKEDDRVAVSGKA